MQRLILLRHAEAESSAAGGDIRRALTERGWREARAAGAALAARGLVPETVLVSPATRAQQTWEAVSPAFPAARMTVDEGLYHAGPSGLLEAAVGAGAASVMVVAHNPGLHQLALELAAEANAFVADLQTFAPASAAAFRFVDGSPRFEAALHPGEPAARVYKILPARDWERALVAGAFEGSDVDARDGFIHLSAADQVAETARRHFAGQDGLVLVAFAPERLGPALKWEPSRGGALFPHLYGPLPASAALESRPLPLGADGAPDPGRLTR